MGSNEAKRSTAPALPGHSRRTSRLITAATWLAIAYAVAIAILCVWDGLRIARPPASNLQFADGEYRVQGVEKGDVLDVAGVRPGDEIVAMNGERFRDRLDMLDRFHALAPGSSVTFEVTRAGAPLLLHVRTWQNLSIRELAPVLATVAVLLGLGATVMVFGSRSPATSLFVLFCVSSAINDAAALTVIPGSAWPQRVLSFAYAITSLVGPALLLHLFLTFPVRGRLQRRLLPLVPVAYAIQLGLGLSYYLPTVMPRAVGLLALPGLRGVLLAGFQTSVAGCYLVSAVSLAAVASRAPTEQIGRQARLLVTAFGLLLGVHLLQEVPRLIAGRHVFDPFTFSLSDTIVPLFVAAAIVFHRMFGIDVLVRHGLVYGAASVGVGGLFVATMAGAGWAIGRAWPELDTAVIAVAAALAAIAFQPLRRIAQDGVDRVFYRKRYDYRRALGEAANRLAGILDTDAAARFLKAHLDENIQPSWSAVLGRGLPGAAFLALGEAEAPVCEGSEAEALEDRLRAAGAVLAVPAGGLPGLPHAVLIAPIRQGDAVLGAIVVGPRRADVPYLPEDRDLLATLASLAAPVLERCRLLQERSLRERLALVGSAASALVHELKNPLAAVKSTAAVLRRRLPDDPRGRELTEIIEREVDRLSDEVVAVLAYVRPPRGQTATVDLETLVRQLTSVVEGDFRSAGVEVQVHEADGQCAISGDQERLRQALLNLLLNAREAMPTGGVVSVELRPWLDREGARVGSEMVVADTGAGFSPEIIDRVFEPFFTTKRLGTGLGLANVKRVVEDHGGAVLVGNRPGGGAMVTVRLPGAKRIPGSSAG